MTKDKPKIKLSHDDMVEAWTYTYGQMSEWNSDYFCISHRYEKWLNGWILPIEVEWWIDEMQEKYGEWVE